ncbi:MAG: hypothetical protein IH596_03250 [Bacteroidales bacterium]|nr:hypothetical protein [Bacteroidales bacterium]
MKTRLLQNIALAVALVLYTAYGKAQTSSSFSLQFQKEMSPIPLSGRAFVILSSDTAVSPDIPDPFHPFITFGMNFRNWNPGEQLLLNQKNVDFFLLSPDSLRGYYSLRVVIDTDTTSSILEQNGTCFSDEIRIYAEPGKANRFEVEIKHMLSGRGFREKKNIRLLRVESKLLSDFYKQPSYIEAAVILPNSYFEDSLKQYPTMYVFPGWGSTHTAATRNNFQQTRYGMTGIGEEKITVFLNQDCSYGFHVFADSYNNGPRSSSFISEFIPAFESKFRAISDPHARFLTGQSSGGWAALWLMVNYPDTFGMVWAASPDPVDFREFMHINLYAPDANLYYQSNGSLTPGIRSDKITFPIREWIDMETTMGNGGQFQSFEAVFGKQGTNRKPQPLFDRQTGNISPTTIKDWESYDINRIILKQGKDIKDKLDGKITIVVAGDDPFFLDLPVRKLKETCEQTGINADIRILTEGGHNTWSDEIRQEMHRKMDDIYKNNRSK